MSDGIITFLASFLIWVILVSLFALWLIDGRIKKEVALHAIAAGLIAWLVAEIIKSLIPSTRPFDINGLTPLTLSVPGDGAFPSGHVAFTFGIGVSILRHKKLLGLVFILMALGVGVGRVLGNVHSSLDIAAGALIGTISALIIGKIHFFKLLNKKL
jgi:undecaprenyl-diphosphatase